MSKVLTTTTVLRCPHGGVVEAIPRQHQGRSAQAMMLTAADIFVVVGCPSQLPSTGAPNPCVSVRWLRPSAHVRVGGQPALHEDSVGLCLNATQTPQGVAQIGPQHQPTKTQ